MLRNGHEGESQSLKVEELSEAHLRNVLGASIYADWYHVDPLDIGSFDEIVRTHTM